MNIGFKINSMAENKFPVLVYSLHFSYTEILFHDFIAVERLYSKPQPPLLAKAFFILFVFGLGNARLNSIFLVL
jgi:hypothetical protein